MINLDCDELISLARCSRLDVLPVRRCGRPIHTATWHRWATRGLHGIVLETIRVGGTRCTTRGAIESFFRSLTYATARVQSAAPTGGGQSPVAAAIADGLANAEKECADNGL
jgi:hypothetical protein